MPIQQTPTRYGLTADEYLLGEFTLVIKSPLYDKADSLAAKIRELIVHEFNKANPIVALEYELVIEETEVWTGSRKSRNKARLRKKLREAARAQQQAKKRSALETVKVWFNRALIALSLASTDGEKIRHNYDQAVETAIWLINKIEGNDVKIENQKSYPLDSPIQKNKFDKDKPDCDDPYLT